MGTQSTWESRSRRVGKRTMKTLFFVAAFLALALGAPQEEAQSGPNPEAEATDHTDMATTAMATDMATTTERGLLMPSQLLKLLPTLRLRLIPGMDTTATATGHTGYGYYGYRPYG